MFKPYRKVVLKSKIRKHKEKARKHSEIVSDCAFKVMDWQQQLQDEYDYNGADKEA